jgi:NADH-quinone oxidoreductase subunit L
MGIIAAILTAFYSWRLIIMTFHGESRADEKTLAHVHESPKVMIIPLLVLAAGAIFAGWLGYEYFVGHDMKAFWGDSLYVLPGKDPIEAAHHVPGWVKLLPIIVAVVGILAAYYAYMLNKDLPGKIAARFQGTYKFLLNKWYFDELYDFLFVRPAHRLGRNLWKDGDGAVIDGLGPDGVASAARYLAERVARLQSGFVYHYAFAMLIGVAGIVTWYLFTRAG